MFQSISWSEFLITVGSLSVIYYLGLTALLYREEVTRFFSNGLRRQGGKLEDGTASDEDSLMGSTGPRAAGTNHDNEELSFAPFPNDKANNDDGDAFARHADQALVGSIADLGEDIKKISSSAAQASREELRENFTGLLKKYSKLGLTSYRSTISLLISETISEKTSHKVDLKEIDAWWSADK